VEGQQKNKEILIMAKISESFKILLEYFTHVGEVPSKREYIQLGNKAPIPHKNLKRIFGVSSDYYKIIKHIKHTYPSEWAKIGTTILEEPPKVPELKPTVTTQKVEPEVIEETLEAPKDELSPLEKLRAVTGESSE